MLQIRRYDTTPIFRGSVFILKNICDTLIFSIQEVLGWEKQIKCFRVTANLPIWA